MCFKETNQEDVFRTLKLDYAKNIFVNIDYMIGYWLLGSTDMVQTSCTRIRNAIILLSLRCRLSASFSLNINMRLSSKRQMN